MTFSSVKTIAFVGGTGTTGAFFIDEFQKSGQEFKVTLITRKESAEAATAKYADIPQFTVRGVDYSDSADLVKALAGHDLVLSLIGGVGLGTEQLALVNAASTAGVKYFVPSEFGSDITYPDNRGLPIFSPKHAVRQAVENSGLTYIYVVTGFFADFFLNPFYNWDLEKSSVVVPGDGSAKASFILRTDVAKYTIGVLKHAEEFSNKTVRVTGGLLSFNDWVEKVEKASGKKFAVTDQPIEEIDAKIDADVKATGGWTTLGDQLRSVIGKGNGRIDLGENELDNDKFPDITPESIDEYILSLFD
ncbi:NAD(P)-binding protein [Linderina pennispora]|uniref:NAD(P)-binding protein n=1 Tax=Linderina pennispora TaxID=61395 RepID=A0A1Y1WAF9_9FUNG|nr:NAD(P)-binding protein [Linderina pennispora]ORX70540.1 NAD(P)-binding protein [Linderina pennispora]